MDNFDWITFGYLTMGGLTKGGIYALIALGYTMVYGIIELINFAHGEIYMIGAFTALIATGLLGALALPLPLLLLATVLIAATYCACYGFTLEKVAYRPLRGAPRLSPLISALGMSIFLLNYVAMAQTQQTLRFQSLMPDFTLPESLELILDPVSLAIILSSAFLMVALTLFIKYTRMGKAMRATAQNPKMATLIGINPDRIISATFIIGSALAAVGGVLISSHMGACSFTMGYLAGIKAFTAAVLGGIGSIPGAMLGGLVLGLCESYAAYYVSSSYEDSFAFIILIIILILRPSGLLGKAKTQKV